MSIVSACARTLMALILWATWSIAHAAAKPVVIEDATPIPAHFEFHEDLSGQADVETIRALPENQWQWEASGSATFGITTSPYWLRLTVANQSSDNLPLVAALAYSQLDDVVFYVFDGGQKTHTFATGDTRPFYPREVDHPDMLLRFTLAPEQENTLYIRVQTDGSMILPLRIWRENEFFAASAKEQKLHFFYYGCLTVIILINLAVFLTLREKLYLYYAVAISGYLLFFTSILGYSFQHFYPQSPEIHSRALLISMPILALFSVLFCREFLKTAAHSPKFDIALKAMLFFEIINLVSALTLPYNEAIQMSSFSALVFFSLLLVAGPIAWAAGERAGIFFTLAWTPLTIGVLATAGRALGFFPENFMTQYAMQIGSGLEAFILTLALADRLYREREDKIAAQADSLRKEKARHEAHDKLTEAMMRDPVTGLPNRNQFEWLVNQQLEQDPDGRYMVGVTRVTHLDEINRTLGLSRSERLLKSTARQMTALAAQLPGIHTTKDERGIEERVYQLSGDSFGILLDPRKVDDKFQAIDHALKHLSEPVLVDHLAIELHPKFGAASYPEHGKNAALLIRNAHVGMEASPRTKFEAGVYSPDYDIYSESRLTLMSDLKEALQQDQTEFYYQPKIDLQSGKVIGLEALIRWHHAERGWVPPDAFIPLAEETGVITLLTRRAFERGIRDLAEIRKAHPDLSLSINISARDLLSGELGELIEGILARHHIQAESLTLELTETAAMEDPDQSLATLKALADTGLQIAIDDFGSGYSSLSYLKQLPATEIKLDRSLVMDICSSESSRVIVETAIKMAHGLGYQIIAEGVEDEESVDLLRELGCDRLQGFWLCHPLPLQELKLWLENYHAPAST